MDYATNFHGAHEEPAVYCFKIFNLQVNCTIHLLIKPTTFETIFYH